MAHVVLFHSILGLRPAEMRIAAALEAAGHTVDLPDLFGGAVADSYDEGFALKDRVGDAQILTRARAALSEAPPRSVLSGLSFGAFTIGRLWDDMPDAAGALLFSGFVPWMEPRRPGFAVEAHIAQPDPFDPEEVFTEWGDAAGAAALTLHRYPGAGHLFLDETLPDYHEASALLCLARATAFLDSIDQSA